jgi:hypothetical protein
MKENTIKLSNAERLFLLKQINKDLRKQNKFTQKRYELLYDLQSKLSKNKCIDRPCNGQ